MFTLILSTFLAVLTVGDDPARHEVQVLVDTIESLQQPVEDFRCEYEGSFRAAGTAAQALKLGEEKVLDSYSGVFIWKKGGDTRIESWHRRGTTNQITRLSTAVRTQQQQAEQYSRSNDASVGAATINNPRRVMTWSSSMGTIFLIDKIKREVTDPAIAPSVSDDQIDGRPLKVLGIGITAVPDSLRCRYWIDLRRNGHVVRQEIYRGKGRRVMAFRLDIKLAPFKVGKSEVWMPVSGESVGYDSIVDKKPVVMKEPQALEKVYVVNGTMEFNKHPGPEVFTIRYKPGTPVSDNLRKLQYEYGQQKVATNPTKPDVKKMLEEQLATAHQQKSELVVASTSEGVPWSTWLAWGFGALVVISSIVLWIQRRGH